MKKWLLSTLLGLVLVLAACGGENPEDMEGDLNNGGVEEDLGDPMDDNLDDDGEDLDENNDDFEDDLEEDTEE